MAQLQEVTNPSYLEGLEDWPLDQVRSRREEANELETGLSYLRRMVQGRLDIVLAEQAQRRSGGGASVADLVDQLPNILADKVHAPGLGRLPTLMAPGEVDPALQAELDRVLPADRLSGLSGEGDDELSRVAAALTDFERSVSDSRRAVFDVLDRLQDEIVRRYKTGEATVDNLLP